MVGPDGLLVCCLYRTHSCADISSKSFWYHFMSHTHIWRQVQVTVQQYQNIWHNRDQYICQQPINPSHLPGDTQHLSSISTTPGSIKLLWYRLKSASESESASPQTEQIIITGHELIDHWADRSITDRDAVRFQGDLVCLGFNLLD